MLGVGLAMPAVASALTANGEGGSAAWALLGSGLLILVLLVSLTPPQRGIHFSCSLAGRFVVLGLFVQVISMGLAGFDYDLMTAIRAVYIVITAITYMFVGSRLTERELRMGLLIYAAIEGTVCFLPVDAFNLNGLTVRAMTVGLVLILGQRRLWLRLIGIVPVSAGAILFEGRTAMLGLGLTLVIIFTWVILRKRPIVFVALFGCVFVISGLFLTSESLLRNLLGRVPDVALPFVAKGRTGDQVASDPLTGRAVYWDYSLSLIEQRPILGYGPGFSRGDFSILLCHNAYLRLFIEFGLFGGIAVVFWNLSGVWVLVVDAQRGNGLSVMGVGLGVFMFLLGWLEANGLGSLFTPVNIIFQIIMYSALARSTPKGRRTIMKRDDSCWNAEWQYMR